MPVEVYRPLPENYHDVLANLGSKGADRMLRHDLGSITFSVSQSWYILTTDDSQFAAIFARDFIDLIEVPDRDIAQSIPLIPPDFRFIYDSADDSEKGRRMTDYYERTFEFIPYFGEALMAFRDSIGYFFHEINGSQEEAVEYLRRLKERKLPISPIAKYLNAKVESDDEVIVNGLEYILLYNLMKNANRYTRDKESLDIDGYSSTIQFDSETGDFTVVSRLRDNHKPKEDEVLNPLEFAKTGNFGLFISSIYAHQLGKRLQATRTSQGLFIVKVENPIE